MDTHDQKNTLSTTDLVKVMKKCEDFIINKTIIDVQSANVMTNLCNVKVNEMKKIFLKMDIIHVLRHKDLAYYFICQHVTFYCGVRLPNPKIIKLIYGS